MTCAHEKIVEVEYGLTALRKCDDCGEHIEMWGGTVRGKDIWIPFAPR